MEPKEMDSAREQFMQMAGQLYDALLASAASHVPATLDELEHSAAEAGRTLAAAMLTDRLAAESPPQDPLCPQCGHPLRLLPNPSPRHLNTTVGEVSYCRCHAVCDRCRKTFSPGRPPAWDSRPGPLGPLPTPSVRGH